MLPQGIDYLPVVAEDPVGNKSSPAYAQVKVDHSKPSLALSGSLTEQSTLGTARSTYALKYSAADGDAEVASALGTFGSVEAGNLQMKRPYGIVGDGNGHIWMVDREANCVKEFDEEGHFIMQFGSTGSGNGQLQGPSNIARTPSGNLWVTDTGNHRVEEFNASGEYLQKFGSSSENAPAGMQFQAPFGIALGPENTLWVGDSTGNRVGQFRENVSQESERFIHNVNTGDTPLNILPTGIAVDSHNNVWVVDYGHSKLWEFNAAGGFMATFGSEGSGNGQLKNPYNVVIAPSGNLLVTDAGNNRVEEFQPNGVYLRQFGSMGSGSGQLSEPRGVAFGAANAVFVEDAGNHRIARWSHADYDPQSGVISTEVKVDGKAVEPKYAPGCATKDCQISKELTLESSNYSAGQHTLEVIATDGVGLETSRSLSFELHPSPPSIALSGSMTEQEALGTSRPRYKLNVSASAEAGIEGTTAPVPTFSYSFGGSGTGNGQFAHPGDVALDAKGNLWAVDENHNRVEEFNENSEYITQFGSAGSGNGQFSRPTSIAIDAKGNIWVTDSGNSRLEEFNEKGEFLAKVGSAGSGNGQFSAPEGITIDSKGNIWVADTYNARLQKLNEKGEFVKVVGTRGSGVGQLVEPTGIDIAPGGNVWVTDWANNRVEVYSEAGEYVRQFGSEGTGNGQFKRPDAMAIDSKGDVWVGDQNNERVQEFNSNGEYMAQFGLAGTGNGQFSFGYPMGIAVDTKGNIWVTDTGNNRIEKWLIPGYVPTYMSAFGSAGAGNGQLSHPAGIAEDAKGNLWVIDENHYRVEKFNEFGEYLSSFGSQGTGNGQFSRPTSIAIDAKGNIWVTDSGNSRLEEFNEKGEFLAKVGSAGSGNGQFSAPEGITIDSKGNIWVADTYNARLQKLNEKGEFVKVVGTRGSGVGQLVEPTGIDIAPGGNVWVTDWANNRVEVYSEAGEYVRQFGSEGTGNGQFKRPDAIDVDPKGNVWVGDQNNGRVQEFNQNGQFITRFGSAGSGAGQFSFGYPMGIETDAKGNIWVADTANNRVQWWNQQNWQSAISTEVAVDGKRVDSSQTSCIGWHCPTTRQWTLESGAYAPGKHTVSVKATDGVGFTASKTLTIEIQRDTSKPTLQTTGTLVEAPEGWVEQESYGLNGSANDGGYGVTSLVFKIDGEQVASSTSSCPDGGCGQTISKSIDMGNYSGGPHTGELVASDGAGNTTTRRWTINVDPQGHVTATEVKETLEALETTSPATPVAATSEIIPLEQREVGNNPQLVAGEVGLESQGVPDPAIISEADGSFQVEVPEGEELPATSIAAEPLNIIGGSIEPVIANEAVAVSGNTHTDTDAVLRPIFDGVLTFTDIRSAAAPESYSWQVELAEGQTLHSVDSRTAEVDFASGHEAYLIAAEPAHDAVGASVPTSVLVSEGDIVTLRVSHHEGSYVYPVVAGAGWEGGFTTTIITGPKDELEIRLEEERIAREEQEALEALWAEGGSEPPEEAGGYNQAWSSRNGATFVSVGGITTVGPPESDASLSGAGEASASSLPSGWPAAKSRSFASSACTWFIYGQAPEPPPPPGANVQCPPVGAVVVRGWVHGHFHYSNEHEVWWNGGREGEINCTVDREAVSWNIWNKDCHWAGLNQQVGSAALGTHIVARDNWRIDQENSIVFPGYDLCVSDHADMFSNGYATPNFTRANDPRFAEDGKPCQWIK